MCDNSSVAQLTTENIAVGSFYLVLSTVLLVVYVPTIIILFKDEEIMSLTVFKLLMANSIFDIIQVGGAGFAAGVYSLLNNVCNRAVVLTIGSVINICWLAGTFLVMTVSLDRFVTISPGHLDEFLFGGLRCYFWVAAGLFYGIIFNSVYLARGGGVLYGLEFYSWYYSDAPGDKSGLNGAIQLAIDSIVEPLILVLCIGIAVQLVRKRKATSEGILSQREKYAIYQVFTVCILMMSNSAVFFIVPKLTDSKWAIIAGNTLWVIQSGSFPFIVLIFNKTIRKTLLKTIGWKSENKSMVMLKFRLAEYQSHWRFYGLMPIWLLIQSPKKKLS